MTTRLPGWTAACLLGLLLVGPARAEQVDGTAFEHLTTGFPLDGRHKDVLCEQCHINGQFQGTPRECKECHIQGNPRSAVFVPQRHVPLESAALKSADCDTCHLTNSFGGAHFAHTTIPPGTCNECHNNTARAVAMGENAHHPPTDAPCDACHTTVTFSGLRLVSPSGHMPTNAPCSNCHAAGYTPSSTQMSHAGISGDCTVCHAADAPVPPQAGSPISFRITYPGTRMTSPALTPVSQDYHPANASNQAHITIGFSCESCHLTPALPLPANAQGNGFAGGRMNHAGIANGCARCHADRSGPYVGIATLVTETNSGARTHIPIGTTACENCHKSTTVPGGFAGTAMVHDGLDGLANCSACHENNAADLAYYGLTARLVVRPPNAGAAPDPVTPVDAAHPSGGECSQCHASTTSFNAAITTPAGHIPTGNTACSNCHAGAAAPYAPANTAMSHAGFTSSCAGCHGPGLSFLGTAQTETGGQPLQPPGSVGTPGASNHIPYGSADCVSCHSATSTSQGGFKLGAAPALSAGGHAVVSALKCANCHAAAATSGNAVPWYGTSALAPPGTVGVSGSSNHIALGSGDCVTCHGSNFTAGGFRINAVPLLTASGHQAVSSQTCASCHQSGSAWYGVSTLTTSLTSHMPVGGAACTACHAPNFVVGGFHIAAAPVMSVAAHAAVSPLSCAGCHENNPTDLAFQGVGALIYLRPGSTPAGLSLIDNAHAIGTLGTQDCAFCHNTTPPFSGTQLPTAHIPLPAGASCTTCHAAGYSPALSIMVHAAVTGESCTLCHGKGTGPFAGTGPGTGGRPVQPPGTVGSPGSTNHIPVSSADCGACHAQSDAETAAGTGFLLSATPQLSATGHAAVGTLNCSTCHSSAMAWYGVTSLKVPPGTVGTSGSANHIALGTGDCKTCHGAGTAAGAFLIGAAPQLSAAGHAAVGAVACADCHQTGSAWYGVPALVTQTSLHFPIGGAACSSCHASSFVSGGFHIGTTPSMSVAAHTVVGAMACTSCHENTSADLTFQGVASQIYVRPGLVAAGLSPVDKAHGTATLASADCVGCHNTAPPFSGNQLPSAHIPLPAGASCATCHAGGYGPSLSIMVHSVVSTESCTTCHGSGKGPFSGSSPGAGGQPVQPPGSVGTSGSANHIPVGSNDCVGCHASTDTETGTGFKTNTSPALSAAAHAEVSAMTCATCHTSGMAWYLNGATLAVPTGTVGTSGSGNHIALGTGDCVTCHGSNFTAGGFIIGTTPQLAATGHAAVAPSPAPPATAPDRLVQTCRRW